MLLATAFIELRNGFAQTFCVRRITEQIQRFLHALEFLFRDHDDCFAFLSCYDKRRAAFHDSV